MLDGEADLILPGVSNARGGDRWQLRPGQFVYYPSYFAHTLETTSEQPANYMMLRWFGVREGKEETARLGFGLFDLRSQPGARGDAGFNFRVLFEGETRYLSKLHCHLSTLLPGAGYRPHADPYDVALVVLEGEIETLGKRIAPFGVAYYAAGTAHGIRNPTMQIARYVVFEFHGRNGD